MYRFWEPVIEPMLKACQPGVLVEIGSDQGFNTRNLIDYCQKTGAVLHVIDPLPKFEPSEWQAEAPETTNFHLSPSLEVLPTLPSPDAVLIDGDHNWFTVINELRELEKIVIDETGRYPVVFLHDVGWPYGRRDLYYEPSRIPPNRRHPFANSGIRPGRNDLDPDGGLNRHLSNAVREGGLRNGVLTAVEDFLEETDLDLGFAVVPGIHSLGVLYDQRTANSNEEFTGLLADVSESGALRNLLERVESMRVDSVIGQLDMQQERDVLRTRTRDLESRLELVESDVTKLEKERSSNERQLAALEEENSESTRLLQEAAARTQGLEEELDTLEELRESDREATEALKTELQSRRRQAAKTKKELETTRRKYNRLRSRRSVRLALATAQLARPLVRLRRKLKAKAASDSDGGTATKRSGRVRGPKPRDQKALARRIASVRPGSARTDGPLVSLVVLTRDGAHHMARLFDGLDSTTTYRSFEVVVVDNGSTDDTEAVLSAKRGFPLTIIRNESNTSFSAGNNQGAQAANGELILFLNNDIEPVSPGWLGSMVDVMARSEGVVAVGAELVYPVRGDATKDLTVQHRGTGFAFRGDAPRAVNMSAEDPLEAEFADTVEVPAATAAALLVERQCFWDVGGFDEAYVYGTEDVDLCLKLRESGRIVVTGQAVLFHHESATQSTVKEELTRINRQGNWQRFSEVWGPRLERSLRKDRLAGGSRWSTHSGRCVAITLTADDESKGWGDYYTAHELGDAFETAGWRVIYAERYKDHWYEIDEDVDLLISLLDSFDVTRAPEGAFTVAWVRNWVDRWVEQPWFDQFDTVLASSGKAAQLIAERSRFVPEIVPLATNPERFLPGEANPTFAADYVFTGNNWGHGRKLIRLLDVQPQERFLLFGGGWEEDPRVTRYNRGRLSYDLLPEAYRSSKIVLDDTAGPTLPYALVNGRVFDALASGSLVVSDNVEGAEELFGGLLPTYSDRSELRAHLDHYLGDDAARLSLVEKLRDEVIARHTYAARAGEILEVAERHIASPRAAIKIAVPNHDAKPTWGDTHFGEGLASALTSRGLLTEVHILPEWDLPSKQGVDVVIHVRGLSSYAPKPAHINVLWIISHPDDVSVRECEKYDLVMVASRSHAEHLQDVLDVPVVFMPQATDGRRFSPRDPIPSLATDVLFVGNSRGQKRPVVDWAIERGLPLTVFGGGWEGRIPSRFVSDDHFPNDELGGLYASAKVVLNDHWGDMRDNGFISNRIFDALASGAAVISDEVTDLEDLFGDLVFTYSSPAGLEEIVNRLLKDDELRVRASKRGSELVLSSHTFDHRAGQILDLLVPMLEGRPSDLDGSRFALEGLISVE